MLSRWLPEPYTLHPTPTTCSLLPMPYTETINPKPSKQMAPILATVLFDPAVPEDKRAILSAVYTVAPSPSHKESLLSLVLETGGSRREPL